MSNPDNIKDEFRGDSVSLRASILALIQLDDANALVPHGIGGHARSLLASAYHRLATSDAAYRRGVENAAKVVEDHKPKNVPSDWTEYARDKNATCEDIASAIRTLSPAGDAPAVGVGDENMTVAEAIEASRDRDPLIQHLSFVAVTMEKSAPSVSRVIRRAIDALSSPSPAALATSADAEARGAANMHAAVTAMLRCYGFEANTTIGRALAKLGEESALAAKEVG